MSIQVAAKLFISELIIWVFQKIQCKWIFNVIIFDVLFDLVLNFIISLLWTHIVWFRRILFPNITVLLFMVVPTSKWTGHFLLIPFLIKQWFSLAVVFVVRNTRTIAIIAALFWILPLPRSILNILDNLVVLYKLLDIILSIFEMLVIFRTLKTHIWFDNVEVYAFLT